MLGTTNAATGLQTNISNLSISINGTNVLTYDGKEPKNLDITLASLGAAASDHNHDTIYAKISHNHDSIYSAVNHSHSTLMFNHGGLQTETYGKYWGVLQDHSLDGTDSWLNIIKIMHNNPDGYYTELAQSFTGDEKLLHRRMSVGQLSDWKTVLDSSNYGTYALPLTGGTMLSNNLIQHLNADLVDGNHAWQIQTLDAAGVPHTEHRVVCQYNINGDDRFFFHKEDNAHEISVHHCLYASDSDLLDGLEWNSLVTSPFYEQSNSGWFAQTNANHAMIGDCGEKEVPTPSGTWCHFISMPHRHGGHHTAQIIVPFFNNPELFVRSAPGGIEGDLGLMARMYSSYNSNPCRISSGSPAAEYLWCW